MENYFIRSILLKCSIITVANYLSILLLFQWWLGAIQEQKTAVFSRVTLFELSISLFILSIVFMTLRIWKRPKNDINAFLGQNKESWYFTWNKIDYWNFNDSNNVWHTYWYVFYLDTVFTFPNSFPSISKIYHCNLYYFCLSYVFDNCIPFYYIFIYILFIFSCVFIHILFRFMLFLNFYIIFRFLFYIFYIL